MKKEELQESILKYVGEEDLNLIKSVSSADYNLYLAKNIDYSESYYVKGTPESLKKFKALYRMFSAQVGQPSSEQFMISDYVDALMNNKQSEENLIGREKDVLFLYIHKNLVNVGKSELWITTKALDKVTNRKRNGYVTIILSERVCPDIENAKELKVITFISGSNNIQKINESSARVDSDCTCY